MKKFNIHFLHLLAIFFLPLNVIWAQSNSLKSPNISANALFLYQHNTSGKMPSTESPNGIDIQEAEVAMYADVDPYSRLNLILSIHPDYSYDTDLKKLDESWQVEPEEVYATSNYVNHLTLKVGKFKAAFGKHNLVHTHAYPFVDAPLNNSQLLGDEGLNDPGISAAYLLPISAFFSELTVEYLRGKGENNEFNAKSNNDGVGLVHWKNLWDLSEDLTFELGASIAKGRNSLNGMTTLRGLDATFRLLPVEGGKYHSLTFASEFISRKLEQGNVPLTEKARGINLWGQYQFAERWALLARWERLKVSDSSIVAYTHEAQDLSLPNLTSKKKSLALQFTATEFSSFKIEFDKLEGPKLENGETTDKRIFLQANFTIGAHPAHAY